MVCWHQIRNSKLKTLCIQFHRCYIHIPHASFLNSTPKPCPMEMPLPYSVFHGRPTSFCNSVRFLAAPIQFQAKFKKEEDDTNGRRLNDQIKAQYVRLVMDDGGHSIVSRFEALERARRLKLDLVEVQKNANPPVCKIMDFHKETYKRQEKEKERAKSKSEVTLRRECKEVRFSEKTELKDLKMKADMVKKLMEKGYRVKCRATGNENQDLTGSLSRLLALIEDVCLVESGPSLTRKEAFMIVRHIKYGPSKKGGRKSQEAAQMSVKAEEGNKEDLTANSSDSIEYENQNSAESGFETEEKVLSDGDKQISLSVGRSDKRIKDRNDSVSPPVLENRYRRADHVAENKVRSNAQVPPPVETENRYKRAEPRNRFQQTSNTAGPGIRDEGRRIPPNLNHTRHVPVDINGNPRIENTKQSINATPGSRNSMPSHDNMSRHPGAANTPSSGYGIFSGSKGPETQGVTAEMHRNRESNS